MSIFKANFEDDSQGLSLNKFFLFLITFFTDLNLPCKMVRTSVHTYRYTERAHNTCSFQRNKINVRNYLHKSNHSI